MGSRSLRSLSYRTYLIFTRFQGEVVDLGEALAVTNPSSPVNLFGNLLVFREPPRAGDRPNWEALFTEHVGRPPITGLKHLGRVPVRFAAAGLCCLNRVGVG